MQFPSLTPPSLRLFKNGDIRIKIEREKNNNNEGSSNNTHRQVLSMLATSARSGWEALGIPKRRPRQKQLKASRRKVRLLDREQRHHQYHFWQNKTTKKNPKPKNCFKKKSKGHPSNSRIRGWVGGGAQNWPALLGSHCSRRTMLGSLLAPRMNSSRESFPRKEDNR